ncbi:MAG: hypothetical protein MJK04_17875, partial [Psychrosphaera sp.]|nr:hypothetical protein [Psychrosphaera sp.]
MKERNAHKNVTIIGVGFILTTLSGLAFADTSTHYTPYNGNGSGDSNFGKSWYLDRHNVDCRSFNQGLSGFKLENNGSNYQYKFSCNSASGDISSANTQTSSSDDGNGNTVYLDRHAVDCNGRAIGNFQLIRSSGDQVAYRYSCGTQMLQNDWSMKYTDYNDDGGGNAVYLDRHNVDCGANGILSYFKLERDSQGSNYRYAYKCRAPKAEPTDQTETLYPP